MKNIILFNRKIETLAFFSQKLGEEFNKMGFNIIIHEFYNENMDFLKKTNFLPSTLVTFNCMGVSGEDAYMRDGKSLWSLYNFKIVNILVDHPMYYHDQLANFSRYGVCDTDTVIVCIDRFHADYVQKYYPNISNVIFMPLAGACPDNIIPFDRRRYDVIFAGNFTPCTYFDKYIVQKGTEYADFYHGIIDDKISNPLIPIEKVCIEHIRREIPDASDDDIRMTMSHMIFIDLYVRFYFREKVIAALVNNDINVRLVGKGFEAIKCKRNLESTALMPTKYCLDEINNSKISLNVMPGFCDGAHDRIFSSMLCESTCVSDGSIWLNNNFADNVDMCFYNVSSGDTCVDKVTMLLDAPSKCEEIANNGNKKALESHTWNSRAKTLLDYL